MNSFMSGLKNAAASVTNDGDEKSNTDQPSKSDLLASAKLVADAAKSVAANQSDKVDKPKVAGAAADILDSAKEYGKFDETQGVGQYLKQADDYLHEYEKSGATPPPPPAKEEGVEAPPPAEAAPPAEEEKKAEAPPPAEEKKESGSGFGAADAFKAAGSFFK